MTNARPLHFVFKIGSRTKSIDFYERILNMIPLRHEEFDEGCEAACNGPYDSKWSKTMIGYGAEDTNFVIELTYNYGIRDYERGNDFAYIRLVSNKAVANLTSAENREYPYTRDETTGFYRVVDPNGYTFLVGPNTTSGDTEQLITQVGLYSSDLQRSVDYWTKLLPGKLASTDADQSKNSFVEISFDQSPFTLALHLSTQPIDHAKAYGRIAFACPTDDLQPLQDKALVSEQAVLTKLVKLDTPGKASVYVVILADPDGHEICFVGDEGFRALSAVDERAQQLLDDAVREDQSDAWHEKKTLKQKRLQQQELEQQQQQQQQQSS